MFDCVWPTRLGRTGTALTWEGRLNLKNASFARDPAPLDEDCACPACTRFSRAYLRHLVNQNELLGLRLLTLHNLRFLLDLTAGARRAIEERPVRRLQARSARAHRGGRRRRPRGSTDRHRRPFRPLLAPARAAAAAPRRRSRRELIDSLEAGDEIVSAGGLYGVIKEIEGETLHVEIADGLVVRMARSAVVGLVEHDEEELDDEPGRAHPSRTTPRNPS